MKKNFSKAAALLLAAMTVFSAGCSDREQSAPQTAELTTTAAQSTAAETTSSPVTTAAVTLSSAASTAQTFTTMTLSTASSASTASSLSSSASSTKQTVTTSAAASVTTSASTSAAAKTTAATTASTTAQPAKTTQKAAEVSPTAFLENGEISGSLVKMLEGNGQTVLLQYQSGKKTIGCVYDLLENRITREITLKSGVQELVGIFSDGTILVEDYSKTCKLLFYPEGSSTPTSVNFPMDYIPMLYIDKTRDCVYYADTFSTEVMQIDKSGNVQKLYENDAINYLESIETEQRIFRGTVYSEQTKSGLAEGIFSLDTGALLYTLPENGESLYPANDYIIYARNEYSDSNEPVDIYMFDESGNYLSTYELPRGKDRSVSLHSDAYSDLISISSFNDKGQLTNYRFLDLKTGTISDAGLNIKSNKISYLTPCYVKDAGYWVTASECSSGKNSKIKLSVTSPELLKNESNLKREVKAPSSDQFISVGEKFREVRNRADEIEKEFGVRILVGNEVKNAECSYSYNFVSTEGITTVAEELQNLENLRNVLAQYPDGFFEHFKRKDGSFGVRISLVETLESKNNKSFTAAGIAYQTGAWYDIAFDSFYCSSSHMFHHEMWHTVENLSGQLNVFDSMAWEKFNPKGFTYSSDFDGYANGDFNLNYLMSYPWEENIDYSKAYFAQTYSKVTPMEDRATLIEQIFTYASDIYEEIKPENAVAEMNKYPHIKAKLDFLADVSQKVFGYVYWEEMLNK